MTTVMKFHTGWGYALVLVSAIVGVVSMVYAIKKRDVPELLDDGYFVTFAAVYIQVVVGAYMMSKGLRPRETTHVLYGFAPAVGILVLMSTMKSIRPRRALVLGIACLLIAGMGVRGLMTGAYY